MCCACVWRQLVPENQQRFLAADGFELMVRIMREKMFAKHCALKVVELAVARAPACCTAFVAADGLKTLFPFFMGKVLAAPGAPALACPCPLVLHVVSFLLLFFVHPRLLLLCPFLVFGMGVHVCPPQPCSPLLVTAPGS